MILVKHGQVSPGKTRLFQSLYPDSSRSTLHCANNMGVQTEVRICGSAQGMFKPEPGLVHAVFLALFAHLPETKRPAASPRLLHISTSYISTWQPYTWTFVSIWSRAASLAAGKGRLFLLECRRREAIIGECSQAASWMPGVWALNGSRARSRLSTCYDLLDSAM